MTTDEYKRELELAKKDDILLVLPSSLKKEIEEANSKFTQQLEDHLKNSDDKKVENFVSTMETKLKAATEVANNYTPALDTRVRRYENSHSPLTRPGSASNVNMVCISFAGWLKSIGLHEEAEVSLATDIWTVSFQRGISKDIDTTAFKLASQKLPQGESLLRYDTQTMILSCFVLSKGKPQKSD